MQDTKRNEEESLRKWGVKNVLSSPVQKIFQERDERRRIMTDEELAQFPLSVISQHLIDREKYDDDVVQD